MHETRRQTSILMNDIMAQRTSDGFANPGQDEAEEERDGTNDVFVVIEIK